MTAYTLPPDPDTWPSHPPIGRPIDNTEIYVLDRLRRPVPCGVVGELYIGGTCLGRCYLGRPDLTEERFVPHPFDPTPGARVYRTGDLARLRMDGEVEFLGRTDHQVKIRGFRVELGEIEGELGRHPAVREAVVLAREDEPGDRRLVAYVVVEDGASTVIPTLREHLGERLPDYMVPSAFVVVDAMPLTSNGKVDRARLPRPGRARPDLGRAYLAPRTVVETALAEVWREVLDLDCVGVDDSFFDLGGDSIRMVRVLARVRRLYAVDAALGSHFANPTIAAMALAVGDAAALGAPDAAIPVVAREGRLPLSFAQERLWFLQQLMPASYTYNCPYAFRLTGRLDREALGAGLRELVRRHESLRTTFPAFEGEPYQHVATDAVIDLELLDLRSRTGQERECAMADALVAEARRPFDLAKGPLFRARLLALDDDEHVLAMNLHHIVTDGRSIEIMFRELESLYGALRAGTTPPGAEPGIEYVDFAAWQRRRMRDGAYERDLSHWKGALAGAPPLVELPADRSRPPVQRLLGATVSRRLDRALIDAVRDLGARRNTTMTAVALAGFAALIHRHTGVGDLVVGLPSLGRDRVETEEVVGLFVNLLPVRIAVDGDAPFLDLVDRVRRACADAIDHGGVPFERLVQELRVRRDLSYNPLVQIAMAPEWSDDEQLRLPGLRVSRIDVEIGRSIFDLTLYLRDDEDGAMAVFEYNVDLFDRETIERLAGHLGTLLAGAAADPERTVASLPLLTVHERARLLGGPRGVGV